MKKTEELKRITQIFLNQNSYHQELFNASRMLSEFFETFSLVSTAESHYEAKDAEHTYLSSGVAISPLDAAICTHEYMRTTKYIRGVYQAMNDLLEQHSSIHILYAGSGPFGSLVIPLLPYFDPNQVKVTFLDIHSASLSSIHTILKEVDCESYLEELVLEDATSYRSRQETHLIITETMKAAFEDEPQVQITLNLLPQLAPTGIFIPQRVVVGFEVATERFVEDAGQIKRHKTVHEKCKVLDLNTNTSKELNSQNIIVNPVYEIQTDLSGSGECYLSTDITIYREHQLSENECSLNLKKRMLLDIGLMAEKKVHFKYLIGAKPRIDYRFY